MTTDLTLLTEEDLHLVIGGVSAECPDDYTPSTPRDYPSNGGDGSSAGDGDGGGVGGGVGAGGDF